MRSLVVLALLGCGGSSKPTVDPAVAAADPAPCPAVAANVVKLVDPAMPTGQVRPLLEQHCRDDKWSVDLRKCIVTGTTEKELDGCEKLFVGTQLDNFKRDLEQLHATQPHDVPPPVPTSTPTPDVPPAANTMPK
ncbi:MAG: hypothetical protein ABI591_34280 [Kofleriaceae bacterium]